jgi:hypothetical protein
MRVRTILKPGQKGTKRLVEAFGSQLLCVRYRYDEANQRRLKTVELIIDEQQWQPPLKPDAKVGIQVGIKEIALQQKIKQQGGKWNPYTRLWEMRYDVAVQLKLKPRIDKAKVTTNRNMSGSISRS